jgi:VanZ family protein
MPTFLSLLIFDPQWRLWRLRAVLVIYAAILVMGSVPGARAEIGLVASGVVLHSLAYGGLAALLFGGLRGSLPSRAVKAVLWVMAMGAGDEFVQSFFPYRHANPADWMVDVSAALVVSLLLWRLGARGGVNQPG